MQQKKTTNQVGQSILELIITLGVFIIGISTIVVVAFTNQTSLTYTQLNNRALSLAEQTLENTRAEAKNNFSALTYTSSTENVFLKERLVTNLSDLEKQITSRVSWETNTLRPQTIELTTLLTNWKALTTDPGTGPGAGTSGNWFNPTTLGQNDLGPGNQGTDIAIKDTTVFMTAIAASASKDDFWSYDVTNPSTPQKLSSINTGAGLESVSISGNYAYAANDGTQQLHVINITDPSHLSIVKKISMQGVTGNGKAIFTKDNYVYIGSQQSSGKEFQVFDITNPENPIYVSSVEIGFDVNKIYVDNNRAYVANSNPNAEVLIFDVTNPAAPQQLSSVDDSGLSAGFSVFAKDPFTLFAGIGNYFLIIDVTNPSSPVIVSRIDTAGSVNDIVVVDSIAFIATANSNQEFQIADVSNVVAPTIAALLNFPQVATGVVYRDNIVYLSVRSNDSLRIILPS